MGTARGAPAVAVVGGFKLWNGCHCFGGPARTRRQAGGFASRAGELRSWCLFHGRFWLLIVMLGVVLCTRRDTERNLTHPLDRCSLSKPRYGHAIGSTSSSGVRKKPAILRLYCF